MIRRQRSPRKFKSKLCESCGKEFKPTNTIQKYCQPTCNHSVSFDELLQCYLNHPGTFHDFTPPTTVRRYHLNPIRSTYNSKSIKPRKKTAFSALTTPFAVFFNDCDSRIKQANLHRANEIVVAENMKAWREKYPHKADKQVQVIKPRQTHELRERKKQYGGNKIAKPPAANKIMRQRSPSSMSFHADPDSGLDDLDITILKHVSISPGISINQLANRFVFYDKDKPKEETRASYHLIYYRIQTLEQAGLLKTDKVTTTAGKERWIYPP